MATSYIEIEFDVNYSFVCYNKSVTYLSILLKFQDAIQRRKLNVVLYVTVTIISDLIEWESFTLINNSLLHATVRALKRNNFFTFDVKFSMVNSARCTQHRIIRLKVIRCLVHRKFDVLHFQ